MEPNNTVKNVISVDWFETICSGELIEYDTPLEQYKYDLGRLVLMRNNQLASKHFKHCYDVYIDGMHFGHFFTNPRNERVLQRDWKMFKVLNNVLYEVGWLDDFKYIMKTLNWRVRNITRVDIALDGEGFMETMNKVAKEEYHRVGRAEWKPTYERTKANPNKMRQFVIGSLDSGRMVTGYYKSKEIAASNKVYIESAWRKAGLDVQKCRDIQMVDAENELALKRAEGKKAKLNAASVVEVERLELRLKNEGLKMIKDFDWTMLDNFEYLASVMKLGLRKLYEFVDGADPEKNITRKERVGVIDWDAIGAIDLERNSTRVSNEVYAAKMSAKFLYTLFLRTKKERFIQQAHEICENFNMLKWFIVRSEEWRWEYEAITRNGKYGRKVHEYIPIYEEGYTGKQLLLAEMPIQVNYR